MTSSCLFEFANINYLVKLFEQNAKCLTKSTAWLWKQLSTKIITLIIFLGGPNNPNTIPTYIQESLVTYDEAFRDLSAEPSDPMTLGPDAADGKLQDFLQILRHQDSNLKWKHILEQL